MKRVLVIDDSPVIRKPLSLVLSQNGYEVYSASSGEEGIQLVKEKKPDFVFLDLVMPGKDGFETCKEIRSLPEGKNIYIIVMTGKATMEDTRKSFEMGANEVMTKPFSPSKIIKKLSMLI